MRYKSYWDKLLFDYKLIHSKGVKEIYSDVPYFMQDKKYEEFKYSASIINRIALRVQRGINTEFNDFKKYMIEFKYMNEILALKRELVPVFWTRFDGFIGAESVFYAELNYDKPCAQRECMIAEEMLQGENNINRDFTLNFKNGFYNIKEKYYGDKPVSIAILVDPAHYEESHLALLFQEKLAREDLKFVLAGVDNFIVQGDEVSVFGEKVDIILRLFPTEFLYEITDFKDILRLFDEEKLLILNDPRVIISQCKNLYSYLWKLVQSNDIRLSDSEIDVIKKVIPYTELLTVENLELAIINKDKFVIKPVYGRYSEDVFIGVMHSDNEWIESLEYIKLNMKETSFLLQDFKIQREEISYYFNGKYRIPAKGFGNFGIYLCNDEMIGACVRWNPTYLTSEGETWFTPIGVGNNSIEVIQTDLKLESILDKLVIDGQFSGFNTGNNQYISMNIGTVSLEDYNELKCATERLTKIFVKTRDYIIANIDIFKEILSIQGLEEAIKREKTKEFTFIGRLDWIIDVYGNWKLLEINAETPAGVCEATYVEEIIEEAYEKQLQEKSADVFNKTQSYYDNTFRINSKLKDKIIKQGKKIIKDYKIQKPTIGFVSLTYYEDWVTTNALMRMFIEDESCKEYTCIYGNINDLVVEDDDVYLYDKKLDVIFRYYPLDWLLEEDIQDGIKLLDVINNKVVSLNPASTIIPQSKGFFAIIYELIKHGFYTQNQIDDIKKYIPFTTFDYDELKTDEFIIKPLLGREGQSVQPSYLLNEIPDEDIIFQERIFQKDNNDGGGFTVFGVYITGEDFAGIYTRIGEEITTKYCKFQIMRGRL